jgi:glucose/arabinose dehydrogenase
MNSILVVGGVLLVLLGALLLIAALVMYFVGRNKQPAAASAPYRPQPSPNPIPPAPVVPPPAPPQPAAPPSPIILPGDTDATVVADRLGFGAMHATSGPLAGQSFPLKTDGFYIGRDRTVSQVVIETPSVSKRHVWVGIRDGVPTAIDQGSTNGTYLNTLGTRIGQVRLAPGDTLIISDDVARFVYRA